MAGAVAAAPSGQRAQQSAAGAGMRGRVGAVVAILLVLELVPDKVGGNRTHGASHEFVHAHLLAEKRATGAAGDGRYEPSFPIVGRTTRASNPRRVAALIVRVRVLVGRR